MAKPNPQAAQTASTAGKGIPLPTKGFTPSKSSSGIGAELRDFFTRAWEQYQEANPEACIRNSSLVRALRLEWYGYLVDNGYNKNTCSVEAGKWYAQDSVFRNPAYIRDEEVLASING